MDNFDLFKNELNEERLYVEKLLDAYVPKYPEYGRICEAMRYSVLNGGKRLRAIMLLKAFEIFEGSKELKEKYAVPFAAALECVHAYSLVHDDLPAMDNDTIRRGKPTTHIEFGHAMGILTGDALLNYAFEIISKIYTDNLDDIRNNSRKDIGNAILWALSVFSKKTGYDGMIGGQVLDTCTGYRPENDYTKSFSEIDKYLKGFNCDENLLKYSLRIYELKTSQLIEIALMCGGILAGADSDAVSKLEKAGKALGLAFQIEDDILDMTSDVQTLGKSVNIDERNEKSTVVRQIGIENSQILVKMYTDIAISSLNSAASGSRFLSNLFESLIYRKL